MTDMMFEWTEKRPKQTTALPANPVPGMAYVPFQQWDEDLHSADKALQRGTLFPVLDKPFYGRMGEGI